MDIVKYSTVVISGGSGYIGGYTLNHLVENDLCEKVILLDIKLPRQELWSQETQKAFIERRVEFIECDVRHPIAWSSSDVDVIFNFAAIHREPGHEPPEYFETNILGAENIVELADRIGCKSIVFTSSIAPYGHAHEARTESSLVVPYSPYGASKLAAEKIHQGWQLKGDGRSLVIVRPGVIYGPHEDGNVPRLKQALRKNLFCYVGNRKVQKAGGYVKELARSMLWVLDYMKEHDVNFVLYNFSFPQPPSLEEYVSTIEKVLSVKRLVPNIPYPAVLMMSHVMHAITATLGINQPVHPERIKKLKVNNLIIPQFLIDHNYPYAYDLKEAFEDWKRDAPQEWQ